MVAAYLGLACALSFFVLFVTHTPNGGAGDGIMVNVPTPQGVASFSGEDLGPMGNRWFGYFLIVLIFFYFGWKISRAIWLEHY